MTGAIHGKTKPAAPGSVAETLLATSLPAAFEMMAGVRKVARET
jgi:hypothetical protein